MQVLTDGEMEQIWQTALRVWGQLALRAQGTEELNEALLDFGYQVNGEQIRFPKAVQEKVRARLADSREEKGPGRPARVVGEKLTYAASGQGLHYHDIETDTLRPAAAQDMADWSRLCDCFPDLGRAHPTLIPQVVPNSSCDLHAFATIILNSERPWPVSVFNAQMLPFFIELQAVCDGSVEKVRENPIFAAKCWLNSPFMITRENIEIGMQARELLDKPFEISTMPVAGVATPTTLAGALTQNLAEILACNTVTLALDDRLIGNCAGPLVFDMRTGVHTEVGPDSHLLRLATAQLAAHIFGGEYRGGGWPITAAKLPGAQSMMEKALDALWGLCNGARSFGGLGTLAETDVGSAVQLMLDLELMGHCRRLLAGITVDAGRIAEQLITEVAPTGAHYLETDHTLQYFREELWSPRLMDRRVPCHWLYIPLTAARALVGNCLPPVWSICEPVEPRQSASKSAPTTCQHVVSTSLLAFACAAGTRTARASG